MSVFSVREQVGNEFELQVIFDGGVIMRLGSFITSDCLAAGKKMGFID